MSDNERIAKAVQKIHDEYPRVLSECNDQTPLPWLHAVVREVMPRCETCRHLERGTCTLLKLWVENDFGCVRWEAK